MRSDARVRRWLLPVAIGGITRLTESRLSITQWKPVSGVLPPMSDGDWSEAYARYLQIPEALTVHRGITIEQFKSLF